jgi:hypothetical protein
MFIHFEFFVVCYLNNSVNFICNRGPFASQFDMCKGKTLYYMVVRIATGLLCRWPRYLSRFMGGRDVWGTALQSGRSCVWFSEGSLSFFIDLIFSASLRLWDRLKYIYIYPGVKWVECIGMKNLLHLFADFLEFLETSVSWNHRRFSRSVKFTLSTGTVLLPFT